MFLFHFTFLSKVIFIYGANMNLKEQMQILGGQELINEINAEELIEKLKDHKTKDKILKNPILHVGQYGITNSNGTKVSEQEFRNMINFVISGGALDKLILALSSVGAFRK